MFGRLLVFFYHNNLAVPPLGITYIYIYYLYTLLATGNLKTYAIILLNAQSRFYYGKLVQQKYYQKEKNKRKTAVYVNNVKRTRAESNGPLALEPASQATHAQLRGSSSSSTHWRY